MKLSVLIPARNEVGSIATTVESLAAVLSEHGVDHEILVVDDGSTDGTQDELRRLEATLPAVRWIESPLEPGYGRAVRAGLAEFRGDAVAIAMADGSDDPHDVVRYYRVLEAGYECAFGSRFVQGGVVRDYPLFKLVLNRIANTVVRLLVRHGYNDTTNAFKAYRREVIASVQPLLSHHFNLTLELPLKAVVRGHSYAILPISWTNRRAGISKLSLQEMGSRYLFILLYALLEQSLTRGDYHREGPSRRPPRGRGVRLRSVDLDRPLTPPASS